MKTHRIQHWTASDPHNKQPSLCHLNAANTGWVADFNYFKTKVFNHIYNILLSLYFDFSDDCYYISVLIFIWSELFWFLLFVIDNLWTTMKCRTIHKKSQKKIDMCLCDVSFLLFDAVIKPVSFTLTNHLWVKLVNGPAAKTEIMKSFPDLGCETWQQCGTVPPQHFWRQWCHMCDLSPTHCKVPPGLQAGDFCPSWAVRTHDFS